MTMLTCKEATRLVSESQDRRLGLPDRIGLRFHLLICTLCRRYARQIRFLTRTIRGNREKLSGPAGERLDEAARTRITERLK